LRLPIVRGSAAIARREDDGTNEKNRDGGDGEKSIPHAVSK